ncbi:HNH endonuclease signature motif containing protein [Corynebacterium sp.]|uniref:HNH endonuclease signature motif containing protein n=1 Tax=Corynebacterium sp. TaxID=1720 RepID=UPI0026DC6559|nr:HNH endonuclease signature motif containing protein [Corynebacterium sp.]MDO5076785.1 HNH endonuclease signature motif containing protein [Corynebacterium sp.]
MAKQAPSVGFAVHDPDNILGREETQQNITFLRNYLAATEDIDWEVTNVRRVVRRLAMQSAHYSEVRLHNIVGACWLLHFWLPKLREYALATGLVDYHMLRAIWVGLTMVTPSEEYAEVWEQLDIFIVECLSPTVPHQALPKPRWVCKRLRDELVRLGLYEEFEDPVTGNVDFDDPEPPYGVELLQTENPAVSMLQVTLRTEDAHEAHQTIAADAKKDKLRLDEVVMNRLCGTLSAREAAREIRVFGVAEVTPTDHVEIVYADGSGRLTAQQRRSLMRASRTRYRTIDSVAKIIRDEHDPTLDQILLTMLRDGTCKFPGCTVDARFCDIDHVINWEAGGWTTLPNLQCLCRAHHNFKTDRNIQARSDTFGVVT